VLCHSFIAPGTAAAASLRTRHAAAAPLTFKSNHCEDRTMSKKFSDLHDEFARSGAREALRDALISFGKEHGVPARRALLERAAGVSDPSGVPDDKIDAVIAALGKNAGTMMVARARRMDRQNLSWDRLAIDAYANFNSPSTRDGAD
jgi:hypothetical protein